MLSGKKNIIKISIPIPLHVFYNLLSILDLRAPSPRRYLAGGSRKLTEEGTKERRNITPWFALIWVERDRSKPEPSVSLHYPSELTELRKNMKI